MAGDVVSNFQGVRFHFEHIQAEKCMMYSVCVSLLKKQFRTNYWVFIVTQNMRSAVKLRPITRCFARLGLLIVIIPNQWRFQHVILSREERNTTRSTSTYNCKGELHISENYFKSDITLPACHILDQSCKHHKFGWNNCAILSKLRIFQSVGHTVVGPWSICSNNWF